MRSVGQLFSSATTDIAIYLHLWHNAALPSPRIQLEATPMNSDDITHEQGKAIAEALYPMLNYLLRLRLRMEKKGFPTGDPYYDAVCHAYDAMHALSVRTHYLTCEGVGRPPKKPDAPAAGDEPKTPP